MTDIDDEFGLRLSEDDRQHLDGYEVAACSRNKPASKGVLVAVVQRLSSEPPVFGYLHRAHRAGDGQVKRLDGTLYMIPRCSDVFKVVGLIRSRAAWHRQNGLNR